MTAIIQFFTSHFFGNMVYGIINNLITFIFVWFIHAFIPYKPKYQSRKNLTRATLLLYIGLVIISYLREVPGNNAIPIFYLLMALGDILAIWLIPDYMYYYLLDNVRGVWYFNASIAASELIIMGLCWGIIRLIRYVQSRNARLDIMAYILIPASQFILFFITLVLYANETKTAIFNPYGVAALVAGMLGDLALFVMIRRMNENAALRAQLEATRMQQSYYTLLEEQQKQIREMQHDINNHVAVIRSLTAGAPEGTDLKQYAEEVAAPKLINLHYCRNAILNALLVNKAADCEKAGIEANFDIKLTAGTAGFDDYDLVALVSNLLDNAIAAAGAAEPKQVGLTMQTADGALSILCRNSCGKGAEGTAVNQGKMTRGNGRGIINRVVKKYGGEMETQPGDGCYTVSVMVFAKEEAPIMT
jgi:two-component system sensor histidine kinase AgrC